MTILDAYAALFQKLAADESSIPENDSAAATVAEYQRIQEDSRNFLHETFSNAASVQSNQGSEIGKLFSGPNGTKISGNPLLKLASDGEILDELWQGVVQNQPEKLAQPLYLELQYRSFRDELEKIGSARGA